MDNNLGMKKDQEFSPYLLHDKSMIDLFATRQFLRKFKKDFALQHNIPLKDLDIKFINFGHYQSIYVLKNQNKLNTILLSNPHIEHGTLKKEAVNLTRFNKIEPTVVAPIEYYSKQNKLYERELMLTPYFYQARSVSNLNDKFGIYIPEPKYRFVECSLSQTSFLKSAIIAKLVSSFDTKNNIGISDVQVISGDFIMEKNWEIQEPSLFNTFDKMKLVTVRDTINCSFDDYIKILKTEFGQNTKLPEHQNYEANHNFKVNTCSYVPFSKQEIEDGISFGVQQAKSKKSALIK